MLTRNELQEQVVSLANLAGVYLSDGAPLIAIDRLRTAADLIEAALPATFPLAAAQRTARGKRQGVLA